MKQISFAQIVVLALVSFATQAVAQTSISADGMIESTTGGFKFPDGSVQLTAQGACAETCPITASCVDGECKCPGAQVLCDGSCIDVLSDELNCGSSGIPVPEKILATMDFVRWKKSRRHRVSLTV